MRGIAPTNNSTKSAQVQNFLVGETLVVKKRHTARPVTIIYNLMLDTAKFYMIKFGASVVALQHVML